MKLATLFGRPNVGKSTLFNRIVGGRPAIVHARPGSTRDGRVEPVTWRGLDFRLHDTGGAGPPDAAPFAREVRALAEAAARRSDAVLFLTDARAGLTAADEELADALRREPARPPVLVVANKAEGLHESGAAEFHRLGFGEPLAVSAEHGRGVADLLDRLLEALELDPEAVGGADGVETDETDETDETNEADEDRAAEGPLRIAIVGRANVGKSTLLNRVAGYERALVSPVAGTTRDPVDELITVNGREVLLVDTAGIRRRRRPGGRSGSGVAEADAVAVLLAEKAMARAEICLLVTDAVEGFTTRDAAIARLAADAGCGVVALANRWDLVRGRAARWAELRRAAGETLRHLPDAPLLRISAKSGQGVAAIWKSAERVRSEQGKRVPTPELNRFLAETAERFAPRSRDGRRVNLLYGYQSGASPPRFRIFLSCRKRDLLPSYPRYLVGALRRRYGFAGIPIRLALEYRKPGSRNRSAAPGGAPPGRPDPGPEPGS